MKDLKTYAEFLNKPVKKDWINFSSFDDWAIQRKMDGFRCILDGRNLSDKRGKGILLNDHGSWKDSNFPEIVESIRKLKKNCVLDGEVVVLKESRGNDLKYEGSFHAIKTLECDFPNLMSRQATQNKLTQNILRDRHPATFVAFDILEYEGDDCRDLTYEDRYHLLKKCQCFQVGKPFGYQTLRTIQEEFAGANQHDLRNVKHVHDWCMKLDYEGVVLKPKGVDYYAEQVKLKAWQESWFKIIGVNQSESKSRTIGTIQVACDNPTNVKYNGEQSKAILNSLVGKLAEIRYLKPVKAGGKLRFPSLLSIK